MALIYANAVNKRMNQQTNPARKSRKKSECTHLHSDSSQSPVRASKESLNSVQPPQRKKSSPAQVMTTCHCSHANNGDHSPSPNPPQSNHHSRNSLHPAIHKPVQRSKTASDGLVKPLKEDLTMRKVSQPVMTSSLTSTQHEKHHNGQAAPSPQRTMRSDLRRFLQRRNLIQKYDLEEKLDAPPVGLTQVTRRKSVSLDGDEWRRKIDEAVEAETGLRPDHARPGTFQRMRNKFTKWKLSRCEDR